MKKQFKAKIVLRCVVSLIAIIFCCDVLWSAYQYFANGTNQPFSTFFIMLVGSFVLAHSAIDLNKTEYIINDEALIIKTFLKKKKIIFSEISYVREFESGPVTYVKIFIKSNTKHNVDSFSITPLDDQKKFVKIINSKIFT